MFNLNGFEVKFWIEMRFFFELHGNSKLSMTSCPPFCVGSIGITFDQGRLKFKTNKQTNKHPNKQTNKHPNKQTNKQKSYLCPAANIQRKSGSHFEQRGRFGKEIGLLPSANIISAVSQVTIFSKEVREKSCVMCISWEVKWNTF